MERLHQAVALASSNVDALVRSLDTRWRVSEFQDERGKVLQSVTDVVKSKCAKVTHDSKVFERELTLLVETVNQEVGMDQGTCLADWDTRLEWCLKPDDEALKVAVNIELPKMDESSWKSEMLLRSIASHHSRRIQSFSEANEVGQVLKAIEEADTRIAALTNQHDTLRAQCYALDQRKLLEELNLADDISRLTLKVESARAEMKSIQREEAVTIRRLSAWITEASRSLAADRSQAASILKLYENIMNMTTFTELETSSSGRCHLTSHVRQWEREKNEQREYLEYIKEVKSAVTDMLSGLEVPVTAAPPAKLNEKGMQELVTAITQKRREASKKPAEEPAPRSRDRLQGYIKIHKWGA
ncbi:MAG: uncharacterized protein KVP18_005126 [Porospora cf. gigantea A]|uniref:uncharacterized protein n=1 Tax=Porospora cf. gigantea A TaxID=2853593 RepID=UPI00355A9FEA|nr:MAG: hypothetical protein KVP18_005126 [Porospora cf. gigantea A]